MKRAEPHVRERVLRAALKLFATRGYSGASVQEIVDEARVTKPALYYYFHNKAGLYHALLDVAYDERLRLMQEAAGRGRTLAQKLLEMIVAQFEFVSHNRELTRLGFATMFAASQEVPDAERCLAKARRNFEFLQRLVRQAHQRGELEPQVDPDEAAMAIYGMMAFHVLAHLANPKHLLTRQRAEMMIRLFLKGAAARELGKSQPRRSGA